MGRLLAGLLRDSKVSEGANPANLANVGLPRAPDSQLSRLSQPADSEKPTSLCACLTVWRTTAGRFVISGPDHDMSSLGMSLVSKGDPSCDHSRPDAISKVDGAR